MKIKKIMTMLAVSIAIFVLQSINLWAISGSAEILKDSERNFVPINVIAKDMGGQVERNESERHTIIKINGKTIRIDDTWSFAKIDGENAPYETVVINNWRVPTHQKPIIKDGNSFVPLDFLTAKLGLDVKAEGDKVTYLAVEGEKVVAVVETPSSTKKDGVIEHNSVASKPEKQTTASNNTGGSNNTGSTTKPSKPAEQTPAQPAQPATPKQEEPKPAPVQPVQPAPQPTKTYTGSQVKEKLYGLGFVNVTGGLKLNPYGAQGLVEYDYMNFSVHSGEWDMNLTISNSNPEVDQKIRTICGYILPTQGGTLYSILDTPGLKSQTINLDGRTVKITMQNWGISITFGPIIK